MTVTIPPLELIILSFACISFPLYILALCILIKNRNVQPLNAPFFKLCLSLGAADLLFGIQTHLCVFFRYWGLIDFAPLFYHEHLGRFFRLSVIMPAYFLGFVQYLGVVALAANRYCNLVFLDREIWGKGIQTGTVILQWTIPTVLVLPCLLHNQTINISNSTTVSYLVIVQKGPYARPHLAALFLFALFLIIVTSLLYAYTYYHVIRIRHEFHLEENQRELKLAFVGLTLFLLMSAQQTAMSFYAFMESITMARIGVQIGVMLSFINPYLLWICSQPFREKTIAFMKNQTKKIKRRNAVASQMDQAVNH